MSITGYIKDMALAPSGEKKIQWVERHMPVLRGIGEQFKVSKPFEGLKIALSVHLEAKTAYLCRVLEMGGAEMYVTGSNPLSTQDDVAAALAFGGMHVFARYGCSMEEYGENLCRVLEVGPNIIIDDGGDLVNLMHTKYTDLIPDVIGGCEETTTGIHRLKAMAKAGTLRFPMVMVNDADCKHMFDNRYGTGQSVWDGIMRTTNLIVAGKYVVVSGYGWCGKGVSMRAKGMGARVLVCEVNPVRAVEAAMDGFTVMPMDEAAKIGDVFVTVTGCRDVITMKHIRTMKEGALLSNAGHFDVEVAVSEMRKEAKNVYEARHNIEAFEFEDGHTVYLIAEGRLVNLAAGDGHPAEIMDTSFALQALTAEYMAKNGKTMQNKAYELPEELDRTVARMKLATMGVSIDTLTPEQEQYIHSAN